MTFYRSLCGGSISYLSSSVPLFLWITFPCLCVVTSVRCGSVFSLFGCSSILVLFMWFGFFFFKQKTAKEMRISDWSSDVCSSDLPYSLANVSFRRQVPEMDQLCAQGFKRWPSRAARRAPDGTNRNWSPPPARPRSPRHRPETARRWPQQSSSSRYRNRQSERRGGKKCVR